VTEAVSWSLIKVRVHTPAPHNPFSLKANGTEKKASHLKACGNMQQMLPDSH
jgi:hypothetical protein